MTGDPVWQPLMDELDRLQTAGTCVDFWLRDDDATAPTELLDRLLALSGRFSVPMTLAVVPAHTGATLSNHLAGVRDIAVAVHGWSHRNYAPPEEKKQELGSHRPHEAVLAELREGFIRLEAHYRASFVPMLVPPWNRIAAGLLADLPEIGFVALSVFGPEKPSPLKVVNTHVDVMDWRGTRGCRDHGAIVGDILVRLAQIADSGGSVGILTHHLYHDAMVWEFLNRLFEITAAHPACRWRAVDDLIDR